MTRGNWGKPFSNSDMIGVAHHSLKYSIATFEPVDIYVDYTSEMDFGTQIKP
ncbi:MAG: hypothetical protein ACSHXF_03825 [Aquaticitalea sp.]